MRDKVIKLKLMNKNKQHIGLKMSSVETRTAHSLAVEKRATISKRIDDSILIEDNINILENRIFPQKTFSHLQFKKFEVFGWG